MPSRYLICDRLKVFERCHISREFWYFRKKKTTFVWVLARTIHNFCKNEYMNTSICWIFLKCFLSLNFKMERWNHVKRFYNIRSFDFNLIYWGNKMFLSNNKKLKYAKYANLQYLNNHTYECFMMISNIIAEISANSNFGYTYGYEKQICNFAW